MRRRWCRPIRGRKKPLLCIAFTLLITRIIYSYFSSIPQGFSFVWQKEWSCQALHDRQKILSNLCSGYFKYEVGGNLCHDLCITKKLTLSSCISHKNTTIVFTGKWGNKRVVFKKKEKSRSYDFEDSRIAYILANSDLDSPKKPGYYLTEYADFIYEHVLSEVHYEKLRQRFSPKDILTQMYHPHSLTNFSFADMRSLWQLLQQEEFIKLQLLQEMKHIPRVYGFCGVFYAMERVESLEGHFNVFLRRPKPWTKRVRIAQELLDLIREFKRTSLGKLHHCDVQPANFGLSENGTVVTLDIDTVFTSPQMTQYMAQGNCSSNHDCTFFDCMSLCDKKSNLCTSKVVSNNLQNICRDLFVSIWAEPGILKRSPIYAANKLDPVLDECAAQAKSPWKPTKEKRILKRLTSLLQENLQK